MFHRVIASRLYCHPSGLQSLWICNIPKCDPEMISAVLLVLGSALNPIQHFTEKNPFVSMSLAAFRLPSVIQIPPSACSLDCLSLYSLS